MILVMEQLLALIYVAGGTFLGGGGCGGGWFCSSQLPMNGEVPVSPFKVPLRHLAARY
jgi:hypothetical protein